MPGKICATLYGGLNMTGSNLPMAYSSYRNCPYRQVHAKRLANMVHSGDIGVTVTRHDLPLLGENSKMAARPRLLAKPHGANPELPARLTGSPLGATCEYLETLDRDIGVEGTQLEEDMNSPETSRDSENSAALAKLFAIVRTSAILNGRTVIQAQISHQMTRRIVELEQEEGRSDICQAAEACTDDVQGDQDIPLQYFRECARH